MSNLKTQLSNAYGFIVGSVSGAVNYAAYLTFISIGPLTAFYTTQYISCKFAGGQQVLGDRLSKFIGLYTFIKQGDIILNYAQASAKKIEIVVEKGFLVDYILGNNIDAYGILNWLSDVKGEVIPIVWKPYQASVATISKFAYITAYSATWIGYAIPGSFLFKQISNNVNKAIHPNIYPTNADSSIEKISIGFLVATIAIGVYTTPEVHKLACSVAKNVELIFENSLGLIADQDGLLDL